MSQQEEKSCVKKMRERHERIKQSIKPSKELVEIFSKKENLKSDTHNINKKVARPFTPEAGA
jgi:hypothetical protein